VRSNRLTEYRRQMGKLTEFADPNLRSSFPRDQRFFSISRGSVKGRNDQSAEVRHSRMRRSGQVAKCALPSAMSATSHKGRSRLARFGSRTVHHRTSRYVKVLVSLSQYYNPNTTTLTSAAKCADCSPPSLPQRVARDEIVLGHGAPSQSGLNQTGGASFRAVRSAAIFSLTLSS
jgi:hypothetical protein